MYAIIKNITVGELSLPEFSLRLGATLKVPYSRKLQEYVARKLIKIVQIVNK